MASRNRPTAWASIVIFMSGSMLVMESQLIRTHAGFRPSPTEHTIRSTEDHGFYVTEDWKSADGTPCGGVTKWKDYDGLPNQPRGYEAYVFEIGPLPQRIFGTLQDAEQYLNLNWCKP